MKRSRWTQAIGLLLGAAAIVGCNGGSTAPPDRATVSGVVTFDGKPLPAGTILFESSERPGSAAVPINAGGSYSTNRAPIGKSVVTIDTLSIQFGNPAAYVAIPEKYRLPDRSGITVELQAGNNENVNFALEK